MRRELNSLVLVMSTDGIEDYREQIRSLEEKIISVVKDYFEVSVSVAVSRKESLGEFGALLYEAMSATNHYFYPPWTPGGILFRGMRDQRQAYGKLPHPDS